MSGREQELVAFLGRLRDGIEQQFNPDGLVASIDKYMVRRHRCPPLRLSCDICGAAERAPCSRLDAEEGP